MMRALDWPLFAASPNCAKAFSTTTTDPSTIRPMAIASRPAT
jgi:hypothetical protein